MLLAQVVAEGVQALEHACTVRPVFHLDPGTNYNLDWTATRLGRSALAQNAVARVLGGGSL